MNHQDLLTQILAELFVGLFIANIKRRKAKKRTQTVLLITIYDDDLTSLGLWLLILLLIITLFFVQATVY